MTAPFTQQTTDNANALHQAVLPGDAPNLAGGGVPEWLVPYDEERFKTGRLRRLTYSAPWSLFLLSLGSVIFALALNGVAIPHGFITGGASGLGLLGFYLLGGLSPAEWVLVINLPLYVVGYRYISRRFFLYSLYGMFSVIAALQFIHVQIPIDDPMLAVLACGSLMGIGWGVALNSLGSLGGFDILAILLQRAFNISIGTFNVAATAAIFAAGLVFLEVQPVLYSMATFFVASTVMERCLGMLSQRKLMLVVSEQPLAIAREVSRRLHSGCTVLNAQSAYTGNPKMVLLIAVHTVQVKRLEEIVYSQDPNAFSVVQSTVNVLGMGFSSRKSW